MRGGGHASPLFYQWQKAFFENGAAAFARSARKPAECQAIIDFALAYPLEGYRRLTFMMLDRDLVAVSPSTVYRVLRQAGLRRPWNQNPRAKGQGFVQPLAPHEHWHTDFPYVNIGGTFYLCSVLEGCLRAIVSRDKVLTDPRLPPVLTTAKVSQTIPVDCVVTTGQQLATADPNDPYDVGPNVILQSQSGSPQVGVVTGTLYRNTYVFESAPKTVVIDYQLDYVFRGTRTLAIRPPSGQRTSRRTFLLLTPWKCFHPRPFDHTGDTAGSR